MTMKISQTLIALVLAAACATVGAETRYVSDELEITLRRGESTGHKIRAIGWPAMRAPPELIFRP